MKRLLVIFSIIFAAGCVKNRLYCSKSEIDRVVKLNLTNLRSCYDSQLKVNSKLTDYIILNWNIGINGEVLRAWINRSTLKNKRIEKCIVDKVKQWTFAKPNGGICAIKTPILFNKDGAHFSFGPKNKDQ